MLVEYSKNYSNLTGTSIPVMDSEPLVGMSRDEILVMQMTGDVVKSTGIAFERFGPFLNFDHMIVVEKPNGAKEIVKFGGDAGQPIRPAYFPKRAKRRFKREQDIAKPV